MMIFSALMLRYDYAFIRAFIDFVADALSTAHFAVIIIFHFCAFACHLSRNIIAAIDASLSLSFLFMSLIFGTMMMHAVTRHQLMFPAARLV